MKDFVSSHWASVIAAIAAVSVVSAIFVPYGVVWGLAWASLTMSAALFLNARPRNSLTQILLDIEGEPTAAPMPVRAQLLTRGERSCSH
jgi:hypothetical protein